MKLKPALCAVAALLACGLAQAEGIAGTWKTIDDTAVRLNEGANR